MKLPELKKKDRTELTKELTRLQKAVADFRFEVSGGKAKNVKASRDNRRTIARILTLLKMKTV